MKIISVLTGFALLGSLCAGAVPAHAQDIEQVSTTVHLGDLDLSTSAGAAAAVSRLRRAAREVCGPDPDIREIDSRREFDRCVDHALDRAVASLNMSTVTAANTHDARPVRMAETSR